MPKEPIPEGLGYLYEKYMNNERLEWKQVKPGTKIVVEAQDRKTHGDGFLDLYVHAIDIQENGLPSVTMVVDEDGIWVTCETSDGEMVQLPAGTILKSGVGAQFFPYENATMSDYGGLSVGRDYCFMDALLPDGRVISGALIQNVKSVLSFMPDDDFEPMSLDGYEAAINAHKEEARTERDTWAKKLDAVINERVMNLFPDDDKAARDELLSQFATFIPEGRYTLLCLMEHAHDQGALDKFNEALKKAIEKEFHYQHPEIRGADMLPATQRGWAMLVQELGLEFE